MPMEQAAPDLTAGKATPVERSAVQGEVKAMLEKAKADRLAREKAEATGAPAPEEKPEEKPADAPAEEKPEERPEEPGEETEDDGEAKPPDPASRGLAKVAQAERKLREQRVAFERERAETIAKVREVAQRAEAQVAQAERFKKRVATDPYGALVDVIGDASPETLEYVAKQLFLRSKGATNPEARAQAERDRREREASETAHSAADELAQFKRQMEEERKGREIEEQRREYIATVESTVSEEMPLLTKALKQSPKQTRAELREVGGFLAQRDGISWPKPADVARGWEQWKRHRIATEFGQDAVDRLLVNKTATTKPNPVAETTRRPSKTINADLGSATQARAPAKSFDDLREETIALMKKGIIE